MWELNGHVQREYGDKFKIKDKVFQVVGTDGTRDEIECVTIPFDNKYYWFRQITNGIRRNASFM